MVDFEGTDFRGIYIWALHLEGLGIKVIDFMVPTYHFFFPNLFGEAQYRLAIN